MTKDRQLSLGERLLLGLTALFLCFLFLLNAREAGQVVRAAPSDSPAQADSVFTAVSPGEAGAGKLDLNAASASELETLPGIGPALAERIVAYRTEHGPFPSVQAVTEVSGIGAGKLSAMEPYLYVSAVTADEAP